MTRREDIYDILKHEKRTAQELANIFKIELSEIVDDLKHLARSVRPVFDLKMHPARCRNCEFVFMERVKVKAPTKCPKCKSEWIQAPLFFIEKKL